MESLEKKKRMTRRIFVLFFIAYHFNFEISVVIVVDVIIIFVVVVVARKRKIIRAKSQCQINKFYF